MAIIKRFAPNGQALHPLPLAGPDDHIDRRRQRSVIAKRVLLGEFGEPIGERTAHALHRKRATASPTADANGLLRRRPDVDHRGRRVKHSRTPPSSGS